MNISKYYPSYNQAHQMGTEIIRQTALAVTSPGHVKTAVELTVYDQGDTMSAVVHIAGPYWTRLTSARLTKKQGDISKTFGPVVFLALKNAGVTGIDRLIVDEFDTYDILTELAHLIGYKDAQVVKL